MSYAFKLWDRLSLEWFSLLASFLGLIVYLPLISHLTNRTAPTAAPPRLTSSVAHVTTWLGWEAGSDWLASAASWVDGRQWPDGTPIALIVIAGLVACIGASTRNQRPGPLAVILVAVAAELGGPVWLATLGCALIGLGLSWISSRREARSGYHDHGDVFDTAIGGILEFAASIVYLPMRTIAITFWSEDR